MKKYLNEVYPVEKRSEIRATQLVRCEPIIIYHSFYGRNAWHSTWINRYTHIDSFNFNLSDAKMHAEPRRTQGSTWYIDELPALRFCTSNNLSLIITEINTDYFLQSYRYDDLDNTTIGHVHDLFVPRRVNSVIRLVCSSGQFEPYKSKRHKRYSRSIGGNYYLRWHEREVTGQNTRNLLKLSRHFNQMIQEEKTDAA